MTAAIDIEALAHSWRDSAGEAGDMAMVAICDRVIADPTDTEAVDALLDAEADAQAAAVS